jgi:hypothetical protein
MTFTRFGLDIAKRVFQVHGVNQVGANCVKKSLKRNQILQYFAQVPPCVICIEACAGCRPSEAVSQNSSILTMRDGIGMDSIVWERRQ